MSAYRIIEGDLRDRLGDLEPGSVQTCVTSPPYWGLRNYDADGQLGLEPTPERYVENMVSVFREVKRVLRDDGTLWLNLGDSYASTGSADSSGNARLHEWNEDGAAARGGSPRRRREGNRDVGKGRAPTAPGLKQKDLVGIPWMVAFALRADGWYLRSDIIWAKPNPMPESVTDRPTKAHEYLFLLSKSPRYYYDADAIREENQLANTGWASTRSEITTKTSGNGETSQGFTGTNRVGSIEAGRNKRSVWTVTTQPFPGAHFATFPPKLIEPCILAGSPPKCCGECGAPWEREVERSGQPPEPDHRNPTKRLEPGQAGNVGAGNMGFRASRLSGQEMAAWKAENPDRTTGWRSTCAHADDSGAALVLDPFTGSGTTGVVALRHDRDFVGIELNPEYARMARNRIYDDGPLLNVETDG